MSPKNSGESKVAFLAELSWELDSQMKSPPKGMALLLITASLFLSTYTPLFLVSSQPFSCLVLQAPCLYILFQFSFLQLTGHLPLYLSFSQEQKSATTPFSFHFSFFKARFLCLALTLLNLTL